MKKIINSVLAAAGVSNTKTNNQAAESNTENVVRVFTSADLWNLQRQSKVRVQRRVIFN
ncbi:MAG TPA: hypothetical protein PKC39_02870 [Ferruginibacter sp.]|nr:hypothetical protein [Ferruginibacter sp.]HMP19880.1 hypothetical protein [Ferruginibacter sp.]